MVFIMITARPKIEPITWTESDTRQFSAAAAAAAAEPANRQSQLDGIRQAPAGPRRVPQGAPARGRAPQQVAPGGMMGARRGSYPPSRRGSTPSRGVPQLFGRGAASQPMQRFGGPPPGQGGPFVGGQHVQQQRQVPTLLGRGIRGSRSRGRGGPPYRGAR